MKKVYCNITDCTNRKTLMQDANGGDYSRKLCCNQQCTLAKEQDGDSDLRISVAKLREMLERLGVDEYNLEEIIEKVKSEI